MNGKYYSYHDLEVLLVAPLYHRLELHFVTQHYEFPDQQAAALLILRHLSQGFLHRLLFRKFVIRQEYFVELDYAQKFWKRLNSRMTKRRKCIKLKSTDNLKKLPKRSIFTNYLCWTWISWSNVKFTRLTAIKKLAINDAITMSCNCLMMRFSETN